MEFFKKKVKVPDNEPEILKKLKQTEKYDKKIMPRFLKYMGKIQKVSQYDEYVRKYLTIPTTEWFISLIIRAFLIFLCLALLGAGSLFPPIQVFLLALGISQCWYLIVSLKQDLWRKE